MVPYSLPLEDLANVKLLLFHDDIGRASDLDILVHIDVERDSRLTLNEPNRDAGIEKALTDFRISGESAHPTVQSHMEVTRGWGEWCHQIIKHAENVKTETLEHRNHQDGITKSKW